MCGRPPPCDTGVFLVQFRASGQALSCVRPVDAARSWLSPACMEMRGPGPYRFCALGGASKARWFSRSRLDGITFQKFCKKLSLRFGHGKSLVSLSTIPWRPARTPAPGMRARATGPPAGALPGGPRGGGGRSGGSGCGRWPATGARSSSVPLVLQFRSGMSRLGFRFDAPRSTPEA